MAKKGKKAKPIKTRSYKITDMGGRPCLKINGDFLATEYGFETGSRVEVTKKGNTIMITKVDQATLDYQEAQKRRDVIKKEMKEISQKIYLLERQQPTNLIVAESSEDYNVDEELTNQSEKYNQI